MRNSSPHKGRGAPDNPVGRFEPLQIEYEPEDAPEVGATELYRDNTLSVISYNDSPDLGFNASLNPYRGCEHGCVYCYARPTHEYVGLSLGLDFETKLFVKPDAPHLLRKALSSKSWKPQMVMLSGVTDCYQPVERRLELTRQCLEVLAEFRNPVGIVTKSDLVTRDIDLLQELAADNAASVSLSVTSLDKTLADRMEPRAARPQRRLQAIRQLSDAGIPTNAMLAPVVPGLNDHEIPDILKAVAHAGATSANYLLLRLPHGVKDLFQSWLDHHYPDRKPKVLNRIRDTRDGKLYDGTYFVRGRGVGLYAEQIERMFHMARKKAGLKERLPEVSTAAFRKPGQLSLF